MKHNMGMADRIIRTLLAAAVGVLIFSGKLSGIAAVILSVFAVIFVLTSFVGNCPLYTLLGIKTCKYDQDTQHKHGENSET